MLSHAGKQFGGYGWAFGLHEALDQLGALVGPLLVAAVLAHRGDYRRAFAVLLIPAVINIALVLIALTRTPLKGPHWVESASSSDFRRRPSAATPAS